MRAVSRAGKSSDDNASAGGGSSFEVTDVLGRTVGFDSQPEKVVLGESDTSTPCVFLNKDNPIDKVVAWGKDLQKAAPDFYDMLVGAFPAAKDIPEIGSVSNGDLSVETLEAYQPDVVVLTPGYLQRRSAGGVHRQPRQPGPALRGHRLPARSGEQHRDVGQAPGRHYGPA